MTFVDRAERAMRAKIRLFGTLFLVAIVVAAVIGVSAAAASKNSQASPGEIDDGAELLIQASISLEDAISVAQDWAEGPLGEVDIEMHQGRLVFNVDIGASDVKVDAANGAVLGQVSDDDLHRDDDGNDDEQ